MNDQGYFPPPHGGTWETEVPQKAGFDAARLAEAVRYSQQHETSWGRDFRAGVQEQMHEPAPYNTFLGPLRDRTGPNGLILKGGRIIAEWGDTSRTDMTFSITKSYLSTCAGLAVDDGLIPDLDAPVRELVDDGGFEPPHNHTITWRHLLQQTSEWEGTLWDRPDWLDHNRAVGGGAGADPDKGKKRQLQKPGSFWEYNDIRVNRASLAVLRVWKRALPEVLAERIMRPIGASTDWEWHGYSNSKVTIDGREISSVSGGGHWGGGMFIGSRDHARMGLLMLRRGQWAGRRLLSESWIDQAVTPCAIQPGYGLMWWLNTVGGQSASAPRSAYFARGAGCHAICVDPEHDMVAVVRWIDRAAVSGFFDRLMAALH